MRTMTWVMSSGTFTLSLEPSSSSSENWKSLCSLSNVSASSLMPSVSQTLALQSIYIDTDIYICGTLLIPFGAVTRAGLPRPTSLWESSVGVYLCDVKPNSNRNTSIKYDAKKPNPITTADTPLLILAISKTNIHCFFMCHLSMLGCCPQRLESLWVAVRLWEALFELKCLFLLLHVTNLLTHVKMRC